MTIGRRVTSTGAVFISGEFDEVTQSTIRLTTANYFAAEFDEVTIAGGAVALREINTGVVQSAGELNEVNKPV